MTKFLAISEELLREDREILGCRNLIAAIIEKAMTDLKRYRDRGSIPLKLHGDLFRYAISATNWILEVVEEGDDPPAITCRDALYILGINRKQFINSLKNQRLLELA